MFYPAFKQSWPSWGTCHVYIVLIKSVTMQVSLCHAQEPLLLHVYFSNYSPCSITKCNWPLCKLNTVKAIRLKLHTLLEHNETMCHAQEP